MDFESTASTNSATRATGDMHGRILYQKGLVCEREKGDAAAPNHGRGPPYSSSAAAEPHRMRKNTGPALVQCAAMHKSEFKYELPPALIAQEPLPARTDSRLLHVTGAPGDFEDLRFTQLSDLVDPGDLMIFNDTSVLPARLFGRKSTGGKLELLLERPLGEKRALVQLKVSRAPDIGSTLDLEGGASAVVEARQDDFFVLRFFAPVTDVLSRYGHTPLPPYIRREDNALDRERYQCIFARYPGAVAAPTAGLHFDRGQLNRLKSKGVDIGFLTLHVGAGTFQPLRAEQLESSKLHAERLEISESLCRAVNETRRRGGRIIAVGTTTVRGLESAARGEADHAELRSFSGDTDLFVLPGYKFRLVDALLTNFHLPESSLLMLVCALAGTDLTLEAYKYAVSRAYRFYSYGDAMFCHTRYHNGRNG
jgi:S-adenosylmethionine:tRNA ribosyltransferase-isomerase